VVRSSPLLPPSKLYIRSIFRHLRSPDLVAPSSTGMTIHSWGAVTPDQADLDKQIKRIRTSKPALCRWRTTKVLIIDEGEHIDSRSHLRTLSVNWTQFPWWTDTYSIYSHQSRSVFRRALSCHLGAYRYISVVLEPVLRTDVYAPQLVITGDFFQLPPVTKGGIEPFFAFESSEWKKCIEHTVTLTHVFRQKDNSLSLVSLDFIQVPDTAL
jgi:ATP-dependent DNA helicase PIF1